VPSQHLFRKKYTRCVRIWGTTDLHLEYRCGEALALTFPVSFFERDTPFADSRIFELALPTNLALFPTFVILLVFCRAIGALDFGPATSAVFCLHLNLAHVRVGVIIPAIVSECAGFYAAKATLTTLPLVHPQV
jgi:hypothetical protein